MTSNADVTTRRCPTCQTVKSVDDFATDPTKKSGRRYQCHTCDAARKRADYRRAAARRGVRHDQPRPAASYNATRRKLREARGPASAQQCRCGARAKHWAYDHSDPGELIGDTGRGIVAAYSLDFDRYVPLCCSCHAQENARREPDRLRAEIATLRLALWLAVRTRSAALYGRPSRDPNRVPRARV